MRDIAHLLRPGHLAAAARHPRRPRGVGQRPLRRARAAEERQHRRRRRPAVCQDTGTAIVMGKKGQHVFTGGDDEAAHRARRLRDLRRRQPALLADGAARHVRRGQHRHQPAGADRALRDRRRRLQVPVHGQGRRLGQQELPVPGDQGAAQPRASLLAFLDEKLRIARHRGLPAVPPRHRHRRHVGRVHAQDGQARVGPLPRRRCRPTGNELGRGFRDLELEARGARADRRRPASARSSAASTSATTCASIRLPRHGASCPVGDRRVVLGRPPGARQDHRATASSSSSSRPTRRSSCPRSPTTSCSASGEVVRIDLNRPMAEIRAELSQLPGQDPALAHRPDDRGPRHRPRQDQGAPRPRRADAAVPARPLRLLRRPGQDAGGLRLGLVRPDHRRPHGRLRRPVPGRRRQPGDAGQGQPLAGRSPTPASATAASTSARSAARRRAWPRTASTRSRCSSTRSSAWRRSGGSRCVDFPAFIVVDDKGNDFFADVSRPVALSANARSALR